MEDWAAKLQPSAEILPRARFGAYLRAIPPSHRVGDYVHCTGRIVNIFFKRLLPMSEVYHLFDCSLPTILKPLEDVHFGPRFPPPSALPPPPSIVCLVGHVDDPLPRSPRPDQRDHRRAQPRVPIRAMKMKGTRRHVIVMSCQWEVAGPIPAVMLSSGPRAFRWSTAWPHAGQAPGPST
jgi:hypothetical protein